MSGMFLILSSWSQLSGARDNLVDDASNVMTPRNGFVSSPARHLFPYIFRVFIEETGFFVTCEWVRFFTSRHRRS